VQLRFVFIGLFVFVVLLVLMTTPTRAAFADEREDAATAYDRGAAAFDRGDFVTAARELARADELLPSPVTLELAINAAIKSDDAALGMTLADRASTRKGTKALDAAAASARKKFSSRVGKLSVMCPANSRCDVTLDGASFEPNAPRIVAVGSHRVVLTRSSTTEPERFAVRIDPEKTTELLLPAAAPPVSPAPTATPVDPVKPPPPTPAKKKDADDARGLSPAWLWVGAGATALVGGFTIASGLDTASKHDAFAQDRSDTTLANEGRAADQRTTFLLVATGALALATVAVGLFVVDWRGRDDADDTKKGTAAARIRIDPRRGLLVF
jgi:hypothetical protein